MAPNALSLALVQCARGGLMAYISPAGPSIKTLSTLLLVHSHHGPSATTYTVAMSTKGIPIIVLDGGLVSPSAINQTLWLLSC